MQYLRGERDIYKHPKLWVFQGTYSAERDGTQPLDKKSQLSYVE